MRRVPKSLFAACVLCLLTVPVHSQVRGIQADLAAAGMPGPSNSSLASEDTATGGASMQRQASALSDGIKTKTRALYRLTRAGMAPVTGGLDAVRSHVARVERLKRLLRADLSALAKSQKSMAEVRASGKVARVAVAPAQQHPSTVQALRAAEAQAAYLPSAAGPDDNFYGLRVHGEASQRDSFAAARGRLASPVTGEVLVQDARREESDGAGLEFHVPAGTAVRAVASGRVAFSDVYGSYGRLVILDHGDGYYTVYGGLGSVDVRVGDDLSRRARIGSVAADHSGSALYFEVRKGTRALPPRAWVGL